MPEAMTSHSRNPSDRASVASGMSTASRSSFLSVITGTGERCASGTATQRQHSTCPYLLLDVRDEDQFQQCHISGGRVAPGAIPPYSPADLPTVPLTPRGTCNVARKGIIVDRPPPPLTSLSP